MYNKALAFATRAHEGQTDKAGKPYIEHPIAVSKLVESEDAKVAALLHDVVEDCDITLDDLRAQGFSETVVQAVDGLTRRDGEAYEAFIDRAAKNPLAAEVKRADLIHNCDLSRLPEVGEKERKRVEKYRRALEQLQ